MRAIACGCRQRGRIKKGKTIGFGRVVLAGEKGARKPQNIQKALVVPIPFRVLEDTVGHVELRRFTVGFHAAAPGHGNRRQKNKHDGHRG